MIEEKFPTRIDAFEELVVSYILNCPNGLASTRREAVSHIKRFFRWCRINGIDDITQVSREHIESFVNWPTVMGHIVRPPGTSTKRNRLCAVRRAYKSMRQLGYELIDPTIDVVALLDRNAVAKVCTDRDIDKLREGAPIGLFDSCNSALLALAEAGATNGEVTNIRGLDVNLDERVVRLPGNARVDERTNPLTDWGVSVLRERLTHICGDDFVVMNSFSTQASEATVSQMFRYIAAYGGVGRKGFNINSVRAWRARAIFEESGRIQDATLFLGNKSLDAAVAVIGMKWRHTL